MGIRISPQGSFNGLDDDDAADGAATWRTSSTAAGPGVPAPLRAGLGRGTGRSTDDFRRELRAAFGGAIIGAGNYTAGEGASGSLGAGLIDAAAFGRAFIANPDLPERLRTGAELNEPDLGTFYGGGAAGYTDYASLTSA